MHIVCLLDNMNIHININAYYKYKCTSDNHFQKEMIVNISAPAGPHMHEYHTTTYHGYKQTYHLHKNSDFSRHNDECGLAQAHPNKYILYYNLLLLMINLFSEEDILYSAVLDYRALWLFTRSPLVQEN